VVAVESSSNSRRLRFAHDLRQSFRPLFGPVRPQIIFPDKFQALLTSRHRRTRIFQHFPQSLDAHRCEIVGEPSVIGLPIHHSGVALSGFWQRTKVTRKNRRAGRHSFKCRDAGGFGDLAELHQMTDAFIASLSAAGAFDGVLADMLPGLLHSKFGVLTAFPAAGEAIEGRARMVTRMDVGGASLAERKAAAVLVLSNDLLARGLGVESLIQRA